MPLDPMEGFQLVMEGTPIGANIMAAVKTFDEIPPENRKALDVAPIIGLNKGSVIYKALAEVDDTVHSPSDVIAILDLDPQGNLAHVLVLADHALVEIKD